MADDADYITGYTAATRVAQDDWDADHAARLATIRAETAAAYARWVATGRPGATAASGPPRPHILRTDRPAYLCRGCSGTYYGYRELGTHRCEGRMFGAVRGVPLTAAGRSIDAAFGTPQNGPR